MVIEIVAGVAIVVYVALVWLPDFRADIRGIRARRAQRARNDVFNVVEGPATAKPCDVRRRGVGVADSEGPR